MLMDTQRLVYPVQVAGQVRTTVELHGVNGHWKLASKVLSRLVPRRSPRPTTCPE